MSDFLAEMAASSRDRADRVRDGVGMAAIADVAADVTAPVPLVLPRGGFDLIAEPKLASPSEGRLARGQGAERVAAMAADFAGAGAAVISVLTEPSRFDGQIAHLGDVAANVELPVMRKDFLVDPIQVLEGRAAGASGVLLIARILERGALEEMTDTALDHGMFVLVELFEEADLEVASAVFDREVLVGVNARDLATLEVDPIKHHTLAPMLPEDKPLVAESGVLDLDDAARVAALGYRLALVGTALVGAQDPSGLAAEMIAAGRRAARVKAAQ